MFTGLVEEVGVVRNVRRNGRYQVIHIAAERVLSGTKCGDSIAVDGVCQTVTALSSGWFTVESLDATLTKTTLGDLSPGRSVNLERALTPVSRLGGHFVQGHVDGTGTVGEVRQDRYNVYVSVRLPQHLLRYCISEGSIAVDGVSLTIASLDTTGVTMNVIPTTWRDTVLADRPAGARVNIEVDLLARYVERLVGAPTASTGGQALGAVASPSGATDTLLTEERLRALGY